MVDRFHEVERVRTFRASRAPGVPAGDQIASLKKQFERTGRRLSEIISAWEALLPDDLVASSRIDRFRAGVVHVVVPSSGVLYEIDRRLREGLETELRKNVRGTIARVRLTIGPVEDPTITKSQERQ